MMILIMIVVIGRQIYWRHQHCLCMPASSIKNVQKNNQEIIILKSDITYIQVMNWLDWLPVLFYLQYVYNHMQPIMTATSSHMHKRLLLLYMLMPFIASPILHVKNGENKIRKTKTLTKKPVCVACLIKN